MKSTEEILLVDRWQPIWRTLKDWKLWRLFLIALAELVFMRELVRLVTNEYPKPESLLKPLDQFIPFCFSTLWHIFLPPVVIVIALGLRKIWHNNPNEPTSLVGTLLRVVRNEVSSSVYGFAVVLFWLFNLAWAPTLLLDAIQGKGAWELLWLVVLFASIPFLLPLPPKKSRGKVPPEERKVLITALPIPLDYGTEKYNPLAIQAALDYPGWLGNWTSIHKCLTYYTNIERVYFIVSDQAINFLSDLPPAIEPLEMLLSETKFGRTVDIVKIKALDVYDFNKMYTPLREETEFRLKSHGYTDNQVMFSLTNGTVIQSIALAFLAMKGFRGSVYSRQDDRELVELPVDIYSIRELWEEITDQLAPAP